MQLILLIAVLAPFLELSARVTADPNVSRDSLVRFPIKKHINVNHPGSLKPAHRDLARLKNRVEVAQQPGRRSTSDGTINVPLTLNNSEGAYMVSIGVGRPPTFCESCPFLWHSLIYAHFRHAQC
jgi:hypothetical protein